MKMFIILFTRCLSVHLLRSFHINLRSMICYKKNEIFGENVYNFVYALLECTFT